MAPTPVAPAPATTTDSSSSPTRKLQAFQVHEPPFPKDKAPHSPTATNSGGWFESRQQLQKEMSIDDALKDRRRCLGGLSMRTGLILYLVFTMAALLYEGIHIALYLGGKITDAMDIALADPRTSPEEREILMTLEEKQRPWLIGQLVWYSFGMLFCLFGFGVFAFERRSLFRVFQGWLFIHIILYFAAAVIFEQVSPLSYHVPGFVLITLFIALINIYAGYCAVVYGKMLDARERAEQAYAARPKITTIASPV
ncbi:hypothetical protein H9P43_005195 [Blastocladiella emersonii ATCC 22665]|nr:hypothetical protein H9P43_005195 [Blastocladiella emersonii ATCC 22665]